MIEKFFLFNIKKIRIAEEFQMLEKITVNCSGGNKAGQKVWNFEMDSFKKVDCTSMSYSVGVQERNNFPDGSLSVSSESLEHVNQVMKPIIHQADESLRQLSPEQ